jgi:hypothetical protein
MVLSLPLPFLRTIRFGIPALAVVLAPPLVWGGASGKNPAGALAPTQDALTAEVPPSSALLLRLPLEPMKSIMFESDDGRTGSEPSRHGQPAPR